MTICLKKCKKIAGFVASLALLFALVVPVYAQSNVILARNAVWRYEDSGNDLGTAWREATYKDSTWKQGKAPLGFGDDVSETDPNLPVGTVVSFGAAEDNKNMTTYFRTTVVLDKEITEKEIEVYIHVDDGAVVYINGKEAFRRGIKDDVAVSYTTSAKFKPKEETFLLASSWLKKGSNCIAVEVHQDDNQSSDLWFELGFTIPNPKQAELDKAAAKNRAVVTVDTAAPLGAVTKVTVGVVGDPATSMGAVWYTTRASIGSDFQVIKAGYGLPDFSRAQTFSGTCSVPTNTNLEFLHRAKALGLDSASLYAYRVGDAAKNLWSPVGYFRTANRTGSFSFIDLADTQAKIQDEAVLSAETIAKALNTVPDASFLMLNGDIVDTGMNEQQWDWLMGAAQKSLMSTIFVPAAGNHEEEPGAFIDHVCVPEVAGADTTTGAYYSFRWSNAHFIVLNTNENSDAWANLTEKQVKWFIDDAKAAKKAGAQWLIMVMHKGPYTTSNHATDADIVDANGIRTKFAAIIEQAGIDLVLQGHDHIYARSKPIVAGKAVEAEKRYVVADNNAFEISINPKGPIYLIPATAGPKTYYLNKKLSPSYLALFERAEENHALRHGNDPANASRPKRSVVQNFTEFRIDGNSLVATTYEIDTTLNQGKPFVVDRFGIVKE